MARFSIYLICGLVLGAALVNAIARDPGYVLMMLGEWQVETSAWLALSVFLVFSMLLWSLMRLLRSTLNVPHALRRWMGLRSARGAQRRTDKGFVAFFEGRWEVAEKALSKTASADEQGSLHPLFAALAAIHRGHIQSALEMLDQAEKQGTLPPPVIAMARAQAHLTDHAPERADELLRGFSGGSQCAPRVSAMRCELAYQRRDWGEVIESLPDARRSRLIPEPLLNLWEREAWHGAMESDSGDLALWKRAPDSLRSHNSSLWPVVVTRLIAEKSWDGLQKALVERLQHYCERATLEGIAVLPDRQAQKMKKALKRWCEEDAHGACHATLAELLQREGDMQSAGELWEAAYKRSPSARHALGWASWLRSQGEEGRALTLETEAIMTLRAPQRTESVSPLSTR